METYDPLKTIKPRQIEDFFRHVCFVINDHKEKEIAHKDLNKQIKNIKQAPKKWIRDQEVDKLHTKVGKVLNAEKKILGFKDDQEIVKQLQQKIAFLEDQLDDTRKERDKAVVENKEKISELKGSLENVKGMLKNMVNAKRNKEKRLREVEEKVNKIKF